MTSLHRSLALALSTLALGACASSLTGPPREVVPRAGDREVIVTDRSGRVRRLTSVKLRSDSVVGLSIEDAKPVALAADDVRQVEVLRGDPFISFGTSFGVLLLIVGAAAVLVLISHTRSG